MQSAKVRFDLLSTHISIAITMYSNILPRQCYSINREIQREANIIAMCHPLCTPSREYVVQNILIFPYIILSPKARFRLLLCQRVLGNEGNRTNASWLQTHYHYKRKYRKSAQYYSRSSRAIRSGTQSGKCDNDEIQEIYIYIYIHVGRIQRFHREVAWYGIRRLVLPRVWDVCFSMLCICGNSLLKSAKRRRVETTWSGGGYLQSLHRIAFVDQILEIKANVLCLYFQLVISIGSKCPQAHYIIFQIMGEIIRDSFIRIELWFLKLK